MTSSILDQLYYEGAAFLAEQLGEAPPPPRVSMREVLGPGGIIAASLPGYECREQQLQMATTVEAAIKARRHCLVEAGTGTGKSLAYLIPVIYSGKKAVVSTGDKALQDQLAKKDLPFLAAVLPVEFTAAVLKGRANYLCPHRWDMEIGAQRLEGASYEFTQVSTWLDTTESGDIEELSIALSPEFQSRITCTADACPGKHCPTIADCWAERARDKAEDANIVIVNHTLLCLDAALRVKTDGNAKVVPDRDLVIVDEAHRLQDIATRAFETEVSAGGIRHLIHDKQVLASSPDPKRLAEIELRAQEFFDALGRLNSAFSFSIEAPSQQLRLQSEHLAEKLNGLAGDLGLKADSFPDTAKREAFKKHLDRIREYAKTVSNALFPREWEVVFVEKRQGSRGTQVHLHRCPITVNEHLSAALFDVWPVVCTSATLATGGNFEYLKKRIGVGGAVEELIVGSPFDYARNCLIYLPLDGKAFDPRKESPEYLDRLATEIEQLLLASDGRAFCLFTSKRVLDETYTRIAHRLKWLVLKQGEAPRPELIRRFKEDGHAVLWGVKSFWEGVDLPGEALSLVIIDKLPFANAGDPIQQARVNQIKQRSKNEWAWLNELALPEAIITLKQGFGRLIRTKSDYGTVALLDGRITQARYGSTILRSLPPATQTRSLEAVKTFFATHGESTGEARQGRLV